MESFIRRRLYMKPMDYTYHDYKKGAIYFWSSTVPENVQRNGMWKLKNSRRKTKLKLKNCIHTDLPSKQRKLSFCKQKRVNKNLENVPAHQRFFIHSKTITEWKNELKQTQCKTVDTRPCLASSNSQIELQKRRVKTFPVYLKSTRRTDIINCNFTNLQNIRTLISKTVNIPHDDMLVSFYGRILNEDVLPRIQPYDSLTILIKGKGGMLGGTMCVSEDSSDEDIREWLKQTIGLSETHLKIFSAFDYLNGRTLFSYDKLEDLASDLEIPFGLSRKLMLMRHPNDELSKSLQLEMSKWSVLQVQEFVRSSIPNRSRIDEICKGIEKAFIDGIVFISYKNAKELQLDLQMSDKFGVIFKRIITNRDAVLNEQITEASSINLANASQQEPSINVVPPHQETNNLIFPSQQDPTNLPLPSRQNSTNQPLISHQEPTNPNSPSQLETKFKDVRSKDSYVKESKISRLDYNWSTYLRNVFSLAPFETNTDSSHNIQKCKLNIIHSDWKNRNELEKKMLFLVLSTEHEYQDEISKMSLWDRIRKNLHIWHEHFIASDKLLFTVSQQKEDALLFNNKILTLSKNSVKMRYLLEKTLVDLVSSDNVFLLISKNVGKGGTDLYRTNMENPKKKHPVVFDFTFAVDQRYWIFNPDDYSDGFQLKTFSSDSCGYLPKNHVDNPKKPTDIEKHDSELGNNCFTKPEKMDKEVVRYNTTPIIDKNNSTRDTMFAVPQKIQVQRRFKDSAADIQYMEGWRIATAEHDGSVSYQCFEFKFVPYALIKKSCEQVAVFMNKETIKFASGCLNARKNGTIMFGIADSQGQTQYKHGEVVGVDIDAIPGDFIAFFTESLRIAIKRSFEDHCCRAASKCISNPVFVKVISKMPTISKFIIEIDIEPSSVYCKNDFFKINRSKVVSSKDVEKDYTLYVREDTGTSKKSKPDEMIFIKTELMDIIEKRKEDEKQLFPLRAFCPVEFPMDKLRKLMCKGSNKLDKSIWPILVMNKPTDEQKSNEQWIRWLKFIKLVDFHAVFDFDNESNINGLCSIYRNEENSILQDEEIFLEHSGNKLDLASKLGMPHDMKTVWIFCNGRSDNKPEKPAKSGEQWNNTYSAGIRDAVIFYSQKEIIPRGRALVMILLFSNNFDGLTETFREIDVRFGWEQTTIIATENILERFISDCRDKDETIKKCSISGESVTWEHVNSTFLEITGCEDQGNIFLTTSTGAFVTADEKFVETLTEFHILSAKQCENKQFKSLDEQEEFSSDIEMQFYRGEKVDWFNFYFNTHVLERHCFDRLKTSVANILQTKITSNDRDKRIVSTVIIAHEPGAGGTTLSRHVLWEFHKSYRCAIITKITERTAKNVLSLWQHKETKNAKPLLLLVDELPQSDFTFEDLIRQINEEYRSNPFDDGLICCFLVCQRENEINDQVMDGKGGHTNTSHVIEHLKQKLTEEEIKWMDLKYKKLEQKGAEYQPEYLLSFMILRQGFSQEYIKNTIKEFLSCIKFDSNEFELLEHVSLLSTYAPTSKRGPNVFIPLECCDDLMGARLRKSTFWEKSMSSTLKMFLIVEQKETASGMQIRMAHPVLAKAVVFQILENKKESLSSLTQRFLDCAILQSPSHGREMVIDFTKEMLVRRLKEEYNDDKTTLFSPLIEEICDREKSWTNAQNVLKKGFEKINDHYIAQTLARLCSKNKDFENGIRWARRAVDMSIGRTTNGFCQYTLAIVLYELFNHESKKFRNVTPCDATQYLSIILDAFDHFMEASRLRTGNTDHILYPVTGVLNTIISCLKFIKYKVQLSDTVDLKRMITEETYSPDEVQDWKPFRTKFLLFSSEGEKAFVIIEQCLCFNTTFYAHDKVSSFATVSKEHRLYRNLHYRYPDLFNDFRSFFGASDDEMPQSNVPEVLNNWHRRCILSLGGSSYMNISNILRQVRSRSTKFNTKDAIAQCVQIKSHLMKILDRTPKDLANLVSVNIVLGLLGGEKRDSPKTILDYCKQIVKYKRENEDIGYFFICLLLWPSSKIDIEYDDNLFYESLRYLHRKKETRQGRPRDFRYVFKEEKNVTQPTSQFFLTDGHGFGSLCHRFNLFFREEAESQFNNAMWENFGHKYNLKRLKGFLKFYEGKSCIRLENEKSSPSSFIEIRKIRTGKKEFLSEEEVYFYLGFSIAGPIAYNVKPTRYEDLPNIESLSPQIGDKVEQYLEESEEQLQQKLQYIEELKGKQKNGRKLKQRDLELMKNEDYIRTALDVKCNDPYNTE